MRSRVVLPLLTALLFALVPPAVAGAAASSNAPGTASQSTQARFGAGFRSGARPGFGARPAVRRPGYRVAPRPRIGRGFFRGVLQALGIAYLAHLLFGWGHGGSPFGLLLLGALVLFAVSRRRRRRASAAW